MTALHTKSDVSTTLEAADRIPIYRDTLGVWQLVSAEQLRGPFAQGFPSYGAQTIIWGKEDFISSGDGYYGFVASVSGTSSNAANSANTPAGRVGTLTLSTGTDTTGRAAISDRSGGSNVTILLGNGRYRYRWDLQLPTLSDGTDTYTARVGLGDSVSTTHTDGVFFRYTHSVSSGNWECVTRAAGTETATSSGVAASTSFVTLEAEVNAGGTSVSFYINGSLVATNTTNIPSAGQYVGQVASIVKSAGTSARYIVADLCYWSFEPTTAL